MTDTQAELWLVRHGATAWSDDGRHTGRTDVPLLPRGEEQAQALAPRLGAHRFALVLCSPLARARDTARLAGFPDAEIDDDLLEWDYGAYEGLTIDQIRSQDPTWTLWTSETRDGETAAEVEARVRRVIDRGERVDGDVLLFAHGHVLRVLTAVYLGFGPDAGSQFALDTTTINVLGYEHEYRTLCNWNA